MVRDVQGQGSQESKRSSRGGRTPEDERFISFAEIGFHLYTAIVDGKVTVSPDYDPATGRYSLVLYQVSQEQEEGLFVLGGAPVVATLHLDTLGMVGKAEPRPWVEAADELTQRRNN